MSIDEAIRTAVREELKQALKEFRAPAAAPDELLSVANAAELADVSEATLKRWVKEGKLKRYGSGRAIRVRREDVLNLQPVSETDTAVDLDALTKKLLDE